METKEIATHDQIRATFAEARDQIERSHLCLDATIDDDPIGRRERGKCRLQVERNEEATHCETDARRSIADSPRVGHSAIPNRYPRHGQPVRRSHRSNRARQEAEVSPG
jgi:hypothetical protein